MDEEGLFDHADAEVDIPNDDGVLEALDPDDPKDARRLEQILDEAAEPEEREER